MTGAPLVLAAVLQFTRIPATATVGDRVTITLPADVRSVVIEPQEGIEIVGSTGNTATLRVFRLDPEPLSGTITLADGGRQRFSGMRIPVRSAFRQGEKREPAPLQPPVALPFDRRPWIAIAVAALLAIAAWIALWWRKRRLAVPEAPAVAPDLELLAALERAMKLATIDARLIAAADAVRHFLARVDAAAPRSLTTAELLVELQNHAVSPRAIGIVRDLLRAADAAKFSPWGPELTDDRPLVESAAAIREVYVAPKEGSA